MGQGQGDRGYRVLIGIGLAVLGCFVALSLVPIGWLGGMASALFPSGNLVGPLGQQIAGELLVPALGVAAAMVPAVALIWSLECFGAIERSGAVRVTILVTTAIAVVPPLITSLGLPIRGGVVPPEGLVGVYGRELGILLVAVVSWVGSSLILLGALAGAVAGTLGAAPFRWMARAARGGLDLIARLLRGAAAGLEELRAKAVTALGRFRRPTVVTEGLWDREPTNAIEPPPPGAPAEPAADGAAAADGGRRGRREGPDLPDPGDPRAPDLPPLDLLSESPHRNYAVSERDLDALGAVLIEKLATFRVDSRIAGRTTGPVVTQFEVVPASGVKVGKIASLADDLALALKAPSVRIIAPIPGKGAVGVEVPNPEPKIVQLRELLETDAYARSRAELPLALGEDVTGRPHVADLARMPHLLIAGVTGSGKSVSINSIITSLIYRHTPERMRLLLVDPKMVELATYNDLPHLRHPVVTDNSDAAGVLKWLVFEMERRYDWLSANACRNLREYNRRITAGMPLRVPASEGGGELEEAEILPYVVLVIDELADLMMTVQSEIEKPLAFLAQKARATGIHLVVATQRPSVNVITGLIKANFPCRIAFRVASKVDSRTIIDQNGAETLLGNGDMLFLPPGEAEPIRIQGTFVSTEDTERVMEWYRARAEERRVLAEREEDILDVVRARELEEAETDVAQEVLEDRDPLFRQAAEIVVQHDQGSTSLLQRRLRIGYGRAARIVDQLHHAGILGPPEGSKPRDVLVSLDDLDRMGLDGGG